MLLHYERSKHLILVSVNPTSQVCLDHHSCEKNDSGVFLLTFNIILIKVTIKARADTPVSGFIASVTFY